MFIRVKKSKGHEYLQVVHNEKVNGKVKQRVLGNLGRRDVLEKNEQLAGLASSCSKFTEKLTVLNACRSGRQKPAEAIKFGPPLVFERLWEELGIRKVLEERISERKFEFPVERAIFLCTLHRLFDPGSDRAAESWAKDYEIENTGELQLHHLYRAMSWLGEETGGDAGATSLSPRTVKDGIEEALYRRRQDLFSQLNMVFFDTTSIYFHGEGGEKLGRRGHSKDKRSDLKQMVVGAVIDQDGRPVCCEMLPGNSSDVKTFLPMIKRLQKRFSIRSVCVVGDRGMISKAIVKEIREKLPGIKYILGARLRKSKEVREEVLTRCGRYKEVHGPRTKSKDPSPLKVKEVWVGERRYVIAINEEQRRKDEADRRAIVASLEEKLKSGQKGLVGNKGYRKYLKTCGKSRFEIDEKKLETESRYDGKWVLETDTDLETAEVALRYKDLWMVEDLFRTVKSILRTRPIYHSSDDAIRGHVFCSFLALMMLKELMDRIEKRGQKVEWKKLQRELDKLQHVIIKADKCDFKVRTDACGEANTAIRAAGVTPGPVISSLDNQALNSGR